MSQQQQKNPGIKPGSFKLKNQNLVIKGSQIKFAENQIKNVLVGSQSAKNQKSMKFNVIGQKPKMVKAVKSIILKDILTPKGLDSNPYYHTNQRLKLQEKPSPTKPIIAEAISDHINDFGNSFESKINGSQFHILDSNQISQGEENIIITNRYSSENLTDEEHEARGLLGSADNMGVSLKRDTENLYYAQQKDYSKFLSMEMRAISPTSAQGDENNKIGIRAIQRSVKPAVFNKRYSAYEVKSQKMIEIDKRKASYDHQQIWKLNQSNYQKYTKLNLVDPEEEDFNSKDMLEQDDELDNTVVEKELQVQDFYSGGFSQQNMLYTQKSINFTSIFKMDGRNLQSPAEIARIDAAKRGRVNSIIQQNYSSVGGPQKSQSAFQVKRASVTRSSARDSSNVKKKYSMDKKSNLTELVISKKDIKFVTVNMLNMNLKIINLSCNKIQYLPDEICEIKNLTEIIIDKNCIQKLPSNIGKLRNLKILNASFNEIKYLPEFKDCKFLEELIISDNKIENLPSNIGNCEQLKYLQIHNNKLKQIPQSIEKMRNLKVVSFEWFLYFDPPQVQYQAGIQGEFVIEMFKEFCRQGKIQIQSQTPVIQRNQNYLTFCEFICYIHICKNLNSTILREQQITQGINGLRLKKDRCLSQTICSNKHLHLLQELICSNSESEISHLVNNNINLNHLDAHDQAPLLGSLRQASSEYAQVLLNNRSKYPINLNKQSLKHGYPLHMAILSQKFDVAIYLLKMKADPNVLNTIGANLIHLLFVKYDKDLTLALEILKLCISLGVNVNLIDQIQAAPIHIALRKKQIEALRDIVQINKDYKRQVFDVNIRDKRGQTPLHYAVEKQDYEMFLTLLDDPYIDVNALEYDQYFKARRLSVIFSSFHKILYKKEKAVMKQLFIQDVAQNYTEYQKHNKQYSHKAPHPISVSNKSRKTLEFRPQFVNLNKESFYEKLAQDQQQFVTHEVLNFRNLKKVTPSIIESPAKPELKQVANKVRSQSMASSNAEPQYNTCSQYFLDNSVHMRQKSMYQDCDASISEIGNRLQQNMLNISSGRSNDSASIKVQDQEINNYKSQTRNTALIANSPLSMSNVKKQQSVPKADSNRSFGPKPQHVKNKQTNRNIDDIDLEIPIEPNETHKHPDQKQQWATKHGRSSKTKIYISNLNINLNNVFINMKNVSIPSTPSPKEGGECIDIERLVKDGLSKEYFSVQKTPTKNVQSSRSAKQINVRKSMLSRVQQK